MSSTHLSPYIAITILLTIFPVLWFTSPWLFCNCQFVLLKGTLYLFSSSPESPFHLATISLFSVSISLFLFCLFMLLYFLKFLLLFNYSCPHFPPLLSPALPTSTSHIQSSPHCCPCLWVLYPYPWLDPSPSFPIISLPTPLTTKLQ